MRGGGRIQDIPGLDGGMYSTCLPPPPPLPHLALSGLHPHLGQTSAAMDMDVTSEPMAGGPPDPRGSGSGTGEGKQAFLGLQSLGQPPPCVTPMLEACRPPPCRNVLPTSPYLSSAQRGQ